MEGQAKAKAKTKTWQDQDVYQDQEMESFRGNGCFKKAKIDNPVKETRAASRLGQVSSQKNVLPSLQSK